MTSKLCVLLITCLIAIACSQSDGPPLTISKVVVLEPMPGTRMAAGYLVLENNSNEPITIEKVTSPQFTSVAMHETVIEDDVARMLSIAPLNIDPRSIIEFAPGGKHLMLIASSMGEIAPDMPVSIEFHYDSNGLLIVGTTVKSRGSFQNKVD